MHGEPDGVCANLRDADLRGANLRDADLCDANLSRADLRGTNLSGATLNWQSHELIAALLFRAADTDWERRKLAGGIIVSEDWCWDDFVAQADPLADWALEVLAAYVRDGDGAPDVLRARAGTHETGA